MSRKQANMEKKKKKIKCFNFKAIWPCIVKSGFFKKHSSKCICQQRSNTSFPYEIYNSTRKYL